MQADEQFFSSKSHDGYVAVLNCICMRTSMRFPEGLAGKGTLTLKAAFQRVFAFIREHTH